MSSITVVGTLISAEGEPLGGRRVVGTPRPDEVMVGNQQVSLLTDTWTDAEGDFALECVKALGVIYAIQTKPERRLTPGIELRCDDYPPDSVVPLGSLPVAIPPGVIPGETLAELKAELFAYIDASTVPPRLGIPFSDVRQTLTIDSGDMRYPNATGRALTIVAVRADVTIAPLGSPLVCEVRTNGTTIFTNPLHKPVIQAGAYSGVASAIDVPAFLPGDVLSVDIDAVGSAVAGGHLTVTVVVQG